MRLLEDDMNTHFLKLLSLAWLVSCNTVLHSPSQAYATPATAVENSEKLVGKPILIRGFLHFSQDARNLWESKKYLEEAQQGDMGPDHPVWNKCITLYNVGAFRHELSGYDGRMITIRGRIVKSSPADEKIDLWACNEVGFQVEGIAER